MPQTVGYSVSPVGDHLLASAIGHRAYAASSDSASASGGPDPPSGMLPMPRQAFDSGSGPMAAPPYAPVAAEPHVSG